MNEVRTIVIEPDYLNFAAIVFFTVVLGIAVLLKCRDKK